MALILDSKCETCVDDEVLIPTIHYLLIITIPHFTLIPLTLIKLNILMFIFCGKHFMGMKAKTLENKQVAKTHDLKVDGMKILFLGKNDLMPIFEWLIAWMIP